MNINVSNFIIETERLYLRPISQDDYPELMRMHNKKEMMKYIGNRKHDWTVEEFHKKIELHRF